MSFDPLRWPRAINQSYQLTAFNLNSQIVPQFSEKSPSLDLVHSEKTVYIPLACFRSSHNYSVELLTTGLLVGFFSSWGLFYSISFHVSIITYLLEDTTLLPVSISLPIQVTDDLKTSGQQVVGWPSYEDTKTRLFATAFSEKLSTNNRPLQGLIRAIIKTVS